MSGYPDVTEFCCSQELSNFPFGLLLMDGADSLFSLQTHGALSFCDDESEVLDLLLANLGLFSGNFVACLRELG
jgi:hypothetical protein